MGACLLMGSWESTALYAGRAAARCTAEFMHMHPIWPCQTPLYCKFILRNAESLYKRYIRRLFCIAPLLVIEAIAVLIPLLCINKSHVTHFQTLM